MGMSQALSSVILAVADPDLGLPASFKGSFWDFGIPLPVLAMLPLAYLYIVFFGTAFALDRQVVSALGVEERLNCVRQLVHFVLAQAVLWGYGVVEFCAIVELTVYGKAVCGHVPSAKDALGAGHATNADDAETTSKQGELV